LIIGKQCGYIDKEGGAVLSTESFRRESGGLGRVSSPRSDSSQIRLAVGAARPDSYQLLAGTALEALRSAEIPTVYQLMVQTPQGPIALGVDPNGNPLERLAHTCFQAGLEAGLELYLHWLDALQQGQPFPAQQLRGPEKKGGP
jgi:hypothetical protein